MTLSPGAPGSPAAREGLYVQRVNDVSFFFGHTEVGDQQLLGSLKLTNSDAAPGGRPRHQVFYGPYVSPKLPVGTKVSCH